MREVECANCGGMLYRAESPWLHRETDSEVCWVVYASPMMP